jgi:MFS superfamily sulfate permease-like transporter
MMVFCVPRLGRFVSKVPPTVIAGFSAGIGAIMFISQLSVLFGVNAPRGDNLLLQLVTDTPHGADARLCRIHQYSPDFPRRRALPGRP